MNTLQKITLYQFRNYGSSSFSFTQPVTCITGPNGSGKTNLLDAVYYLCYTKSYFSAYQQHSAMAGTDGFRLEGLFQRGDRSEVVCCKWKQGKKEVFVNDVPYERINDHIGHYAAVMIAPDDMELVNDGSGLRRRWLDSIMAQVDREYLEKLVYYQRILMQRNAWLRLQASKPSASYSELEFYDAGLAGSGQYIYDARKAFITSFLPYLSDFYARLSLGREAVQLIYTSDLHERPLQHWLTESLQHDLRLQRTLRGIHKDDCDLLLDGAALKIFGSQGQKKSFLFAMKLAQYAWLAQTLGHKPILLLDDIFEKLDQSRMEALLHIIRTPAFGQVLLTDTHPERIKQAFGAHEPGFIYL